MDGHVAAAKRGEDSLHVVLFPWLAFGHINPYVQLANNLAAHGVRVSVLSAPANISHTSSSLNAAPGLTAVVPVHIPAIDGLPPETQSTFHATPAQAELLKLALDQMGPQIEAILARLRPDFIIFDFCMHWIPPIARKHGVKALFFSIYYTISLAHMAVSSRLTAGGGLPSAEDLKRPPPGLGSRALEGLATYEVNNLLYAYKSFGGPSGHDRFMACVQGSDAVVCRTCLEMESPYIHYLETQYQKPILLAGPLAPEPPAGELDDRWENWLSQFPARSVVFCAFGSENFLPEDQVKELACGLELAGRPFILILNKETRLTEALPEGFSDRVAGRGLVQTGWVPQRLILSHTSVGCFLSHAGGSSIVEGLANGLQFVLLPVKLDQSLNARLLTADLNVGVMVKRRDDDGAFGRDDVRDAVKQAMASEKGKEWQEFLSNEERQDGFSRDLIEKMKQMMKP